MKCILNILIIALCFSCQEVATTSNSNELNEEKVVEQKANKSLINPEGKTLESRFQTPENFKRKDSGANSFATYLRKLPLKPHGTEALYYDGKIKHNYDIYDAVVDLPIGKKDLHQCADAIMRLRAEYLWNQKRHDEIHFNFSNGWRADYSKWKEGHRVKVEGNKTSWVKKASPSDSYNTFWKYLEIIFSYAGTQSLSQELKKVEVADMKIGDIFIEGGYPGHAVLVIDMAENEEGEKVFLLAQSYMPAQETHILQNPNDAELSPWYSENIEFYLETPQWTGTKNDLKRFK